MTRTHLGFALAVIVLLGSLHNGTRSAMAYNNSQVPCPWTNTTPLNIYFEWGPNLIGNPSYTWRLRFSDSVGDWNSQGTKPLVQWSSGAANRLDSYTAADGYYGYASIACTGPFWDRKMSSFDAYANSYRGHEYNWDDFFMRSITGHELGHGLGLGHSTEYSIMNTSRDRYTLYTPQQDDRNGLNAIYP